MINQNKIESYIFDNSNVIKIDSRDIKPGDIFLALQGEQKHGNEFIEHSIKKGAEYCITDKHYVTKSKKVKFVKNTIKFLILIMYIIFLNDKPRFFKYLSSVFKKFLYVVIFFSLSF